MKRLPPIEKIYEAYSAIADGRVTMNNENLEMSWSAPGSAKVKSSDGKRTYTVGWNDNTYYSNDNGTYWQLYAGYPVIAVLMLQGRLPYDKSIANIFSGVNWKSVNDSHKNDYAAALQEVYRQKGVSPELKVIEGEVQNIYGLMGNLPISVKRGSQRPPR